MEAFMNTATDTKIETDEALTGHMPNQETIEAILDSRKDDDETFTFHDIDSLFKWLDDEED